jgi:hypothetical protein
LLAEREIALRLARDINVIRKLKIACRSPFFWVYSLSLWDPEAFLSCISGGFAFALVGLLFMKITLVGFAPSALTATATFEYFVLGLILMWLYYLGPWLHPTNLKVILTFIFRLYRQNKTVDDLSAEDISRLFPPKAQVNASNPTQSARSSRIYARIERSSFFGPLLLGSIFAFVLIALLLITS